MHVQQGELQDLVAVALEERRRVGVHVSGHLQRALVQRRAQAARQVEHGLQLAQQALHLAQLLDLVAPQLQLPVNRLAALRHAACAAACRDACTGTLRLPPRSAGKEDMYAGAHAGE